MKAWITLQFKNVVYTLNPNERVLRFIDYAGSVYRPAWILHPAGTDDFYGYWMILK